MDRKPSGLSDEFASLPQFVEQCLRALFVPPSHPFRSHMACGTPWSHNEVLPSLKIDRKLGTGKRPRLTVEIVTVGHSREAEHIETGNLPVRVAQWRKTYSKASLSEPSDLCHSIPRYRENNRDWRPEFDSCSRGIDKPAGLCHRISLGAPKAKANEGTCQNYRPHLPRSGFPHAVPCQSSRAQWKWLRSRSCIRRRSHTTDDAIRVGIATRCARRPLGHNALPALYCPFSDCVLFAATDVCIPFLPIAQAPVRLPTADLYCDMGMFAFDRQ
jgi:hypothetical protein